MPVGEKVDRPGVVDWLMDGEAAVRYQAQRDLRGLDRPDLQRRIAEEGDAAAVLAARGPDAHWGRGFYQPKWTCSHYTLLELRNLALPRDNPSARETVLRILSEEVGRDGGLNPSRSVGTSDVCINGMALNYSAYFAADPGRLKGVVDFILGQRMADGGFNCRLNRSGARHASLHSTVCVLEGATTYLRHGYTYRADELAHSIETSSEFLLRHRLFRSERTGQAIHPELTRLHHPTRWRFDILRGLDALAAADVALDPRMADALGILRDRQRPDGRWAAARSYPGQTHVPPAPAGEPSRWVTLVALRVLGRYER